MNKRLITAFLMLSVYVSPAQAFRCGQDLVPDKASFSEVRRLCGSPTDVQRWVEYRGVGILPYNYPSHSSGRYYSSKRYGSTHVNPIIIPVNIEEWIYNFGPHRFMRVLRFEEGRLKSVGVLERGY